MLLGTGLAIVVIVALVSAVIVQQMTIQRISGQTRYVTQQQVITNYATQYQPITVIHTVTETVTQHPYVLITYSSQTANSLYVTATGFTYTPYISGDVFLILTVKVENNGYSQVYLSLSNFYVTINARNYSYADYIVYSYTWLPNGYVLNGSSVTGNLVYEVPPNYGTFVLLWRHSPDVNVQYVQQ